VFLLKPTRPEQDFWDIGLGGHGTAWAIRPEAFANAPTLLHFLNPSGELLPLRHGEREFTVFNVTEVIDALDRERTTWDDYDDGTIADVERPAFRSDRLGEQIFKVPETSLGRIYYWEDAANAAEQFKAQVEHYGLTGLTFEIVDSFPRPS
jgi:hypothetical protein